MPKVNGRGGRKGPTPREVGEVLRKGSKARLAENEADVNLEDMGYRTYSWRGWKREWMFLGQLTIVDGGDVAYYNLFRPSGGNSEPGEVVFLIRKIGLGDVEHRLRFDVLDGGSLDNGHCDCEAGRRGRDCRHVAVVLKLKERGRV